MTRPTIATTATAHDALHHPFRMRHWRAGYDPVQVDDFLDDAAAALTAVQDGQVSPVQVADVFEVTFTGTRFKDGYDVDDVDDFLDRVAATFQAATAARP